MAEFDDEVRQRQLRQHADDYVPPDVSTITDSLNGIASGEIVGSLKIEEILTDAYRRGDADLVEPLLNVTRTLTAETVADPKRSGNRVAQQALGTAALIADITNELVEMAQQHEQNPLLARYAILILGREPDAERMEMFENIHDDSRNNFVRGAVNSARSCYTLNQRFENLETPAEQIELVLENLGDTGWNPITLGEPHLHIPHEVVQRTFKPAHVWAQRQLRSLSMGHPSLAAHAIAKRELKTGLDEAYIQAYRDYIAKRLLSADAQEHYDKLRSS